MNARRSLLVACVLAAMHAVASHGSGDGLDLVILVDRSGSMARHDVAPLIGVTVDLIARNGRANRVMHRVAIVSFGSDARVDVPLQPADLNSRAAFNVRPRPASGHTDILAAFHAAARLFAAEPSRRRAVLLITDGIASVPGVAPSDHQDAVARFATEHFRDTAIHVALLPHSTARHVEFWRALSTNRVEAIDDPASLLRMVADLVGTRVQQRRIEGSAERLVLPPYLESVVFDVFRGSHGGSVDVFAPGATEPLRPGGPGVEEVTLSGQLSSIVVRDPAPGAWTFRTAGTDGTVRIFSQEFFPRGMLIRPAAGRPVAQHARTVVAYGLLDRAGRPLVELAGYPVSVDLRLVAPDGSTVSKPLHHRRDFGSSVFGTSDAIACNVAGRYWTEVRVSTIDAERRQVSVLHDRWSGFAVNAGAPADNRAYALGAMEKEPPRPPRRSLLGAAVTALAIVLAGAAAVLGKLYLRS